MELRTVDQIDIKQDGTNLRLTFVSKAFLRRQVRNMVNLIILGGQNKFNTQQIDDLLNAPKKCNIIRPAPAGGLYLTKIKYEQEYFKNQIISNRY